MFTLVCLLFCLLSGGKFAADEYTIITPNSVSIIAYSGQSFAVQMNSSVASPLTYSIDIDTECGLSPTEIYPFNVTSYFNSTSQLRGACTVVFDVSGEEPQYGFISIVAVVNITAASTFLPAGTPLVFNATSPYTDPSNPMIVAASVQCTAGSGYIQTFTVNSAFNQTINLPNGTYGNCVMAPTNLTLEARYYFDDLSFQVYNLTDLSVILPPLNPTIRAFTGGSFTIEADNTGVYPETYVAYMNGGISPISSPAYSFPFNTSIEFLIPNTTYGLSTVYYNISGEAGSIGFGARNVSVYAATLITTDILEIKAGESFQFNATSNFNGSFTVYGNFSCAMGTMEEQSFRVNNGQNQSFDIPSTVSGLCLMTTWGRSLNAYYYIIPYEFYVSNEIVIQINSSSIVQPGSNLTLLITTNTFEQVAANLTLTCPIGGSQRELITTSANATDYIFFALNPNLGGNCLFTLSGYPEYFTSTSTGLVILTSAPVSLKSYFPLNGRVMLSGRRRRNLTALKRRLKSKH